MEGSTSGPGHLLPAIPAHPRLTIVSGRQTLRNHLATFQSTLYSGRASYIATCPCSMASDCLVEAFARLSTTDSRRTALQALVQELTPHEWRLVHALTSTRTFQFDIVGQLPVELVSHVFSHLDTSTPWRLQHVGQLISSLFPTTVLCTGFRASIDQQFDMDSATR